jgi:G:T-mismatch repair DNA endonuclease (very short patch repair protein)
MKNYKRSLTMSIKTLKVPFVQNDTEISGAPDLSFRNRRLAVFVRRPTQKKLFRLIDSRIRRKLQRQGWKTTFISTDLISRDLQTVKLRIARRLGVRT